MGRRGNRTYGSERIGTRAHAMATVGWAAFGVCPQCRVEHGQPCKQTVTHRKYREISESVMDHPHNQRKMAHGVLSNGKRDIGVTGLAQLLQKKADSE